MAEVPKLNNIDFGEGIPFKVVAPFEPMGDQNQAIEDLAGGIENGQEAQVLLGATGTGKTFTIAKLIEKVQKPTLVIAHNKTLAAQLASEFKTFFPDNYVGSFVSYYDYALSLNGVMLLLWPVCHVFMALAPLRAITKWCCPFIRGRR